MKYVKVTYNGKEETNLSKIINILKEHKFYWLIDSEFEDAIIEIKNDTVIWESGNYLSGCWNYGIWLNGNFHGKWENGIFENGNFLGEWISGINNNNEDAE
jgi:hypothetical protein